MTQPHSVTVTTSAFDAEDEGSNPSEVATRIFNEEIRIYRAHAYSILRLTDGRFVLHEPDGTLVAVSRDLADFADRILTGEAHYETCADRWAARTRFESTTAGQALLQTLGLAKDRPHPSVSGKIERRI